MTDRRIRITIDGNSTGYVSAARQSAAATDALATSADRSARSVKAGTESAKAMAAATERTAAATHKGSAAVIAFSKAAESAKEGTFGLGKTIANVAFAFGPWGMAIGVVSQALIGLLEEVSETDKKLSEFAYRRAVEAREMQEQVTQARLDAWRKSDDAARQRDKIDPIRNEIRNLDIVIAKMGALGEETRSIENDRARLLAMEIRAHKRMSGVTDEKRQQIEDEAQAIEHNIAVSNARAEGQAEKEYWDRNTVRIKVSTDALDRNTAARVRNSDAVKSQTRPYAGVTEVSGENQEFDVERQRFNESQAMAGMERGGPRAGAEEAFRIEVDHMLELEEIRENSAAAQRERHEEEMRLLSEKQAKYLAHASTASTMAGSILSITDARRSAIMAAKNQGKTDREAAREGKIAALEQTAAALKGIRDMAIVKAIEQTALGIGAAATFNFASAGMHFAAAGLWTGIAVGAGVGSRAVGDRASSMGASSSGAANTGGGYGGGGSTSPRGGAPPGGNTGVPGSPGPGMPSTGGANSAPQRTVVYQIGAVHTYGTPEREFLRRVEEGLEVEVGANRRRAGGDR